MDLSIPALSEVSKWPGDFPGCFDLQTVDITKEEGKESGSSTSTIDLVILSFVFLAIFKEASL